MEQRRISGKGHWYHETQSSRSDAVLPLVPEAAYLEDRFLLDVELSAEQRTAEAAWLSVARDAADALLPDNSPVTRLHTLSSYDRLSTALTVAQVYGVQRLCNHYAARLAPQPGPDSSRESNRRLTQITQYARQLASQPTLIDDISRQQLDEVALSVNDTVTFNQLIGFIGFQARVIALFHALQGLPVRWIPGLDSQQDASAELFLEGDKLWQPGLPPVEQRYANTYQLEVVNVSLAQRALNPLSWLLAHDAPPLSVLSQLTHLLFPPNAATRDDLVLVNLLTARINGSVSCFSDATDHWHGENALPEAIRNGERALQAWSHNHPRERAIIQAVRVLTRAPGSFSAAQLQPLFEQGFSKNEALRLLVCSALYGWLNRLKIGLGNAIQA
ncbi:CMD domain-containing protein [Buttiauxella selenatireducens]|uniref:CMD domain-containing protein n=1 Tax=Buttiauxella selenatireducens TaxID=3073902 RepID=A0ABY9SG95_9ENTR|nr:CMD domain-containing protein [Buttiauxella sp. R73]WMY76434.1 CMD domain-containing protein [Buttiauxella sp. R73]